VFSLGGGELLLIAVLALLLFGPDKVPQVARTIGKFMREFNKYRDIMESTVRAEIYKDEWNNEAETGGGPSASDKIAQAGGAVQDLVDAQKAKEAAAADAAEGEASGESAVSAAAVPAPVKPSPARATDEDEEDEV
jgi:sec-independent protein translocase protein TatB